MMPSRVTDLLPESIAQWFVRRRSSANGSVPADASGAERDDERPAAPPAKRPRYEEASYYAQNDPPAPPQPEPVAGPSGYKSEPPPPPPPQRETADARRSAGLSLLTCNRSVIRHSLGEREAGRKKKDSPLKPAESPVKQSVTVTGSPFYRGRTMYGGAGASSMYMNEPNIRERRTAVPSQPLCNVDNSISHTTRRLMGILERCSTPSFERKTPQQVKSRANISDSLSTTLTGRSISSFNSNKTHELQISHLPTLLKLKQGARLRESTRAARHVANSNSPGFTPYTPVAAAPTTQSTTQEITSTPARQQQNQTNKIKSQIGRSARKGAQNAIESEIVPPLNLPEATLQIDQANLPKFSFTAPTETRKSTTEMKKTYKFSMPQSIMENHINIPSDTNKYKFSKPAEVTKKLTNGPSVFEVTRSTEVKKTETFTEKKSSSWKCEDCWIVNKDADLRCAACTGPRPVEKSQVKADAFNKMDVAKDWKCGDCSVFNNDSKEKCSCGATKPSGKIEKSIPLVVKPTKEWRCNDCWVQNKEDVQKCVACGGSKPGVVTSKEVNVEKDWKCSDCWVMNKDSVKKCIACGGSRPSKHKDQKQDNKNTSQSAPGFEGFTQKKKQWTCNDCWVSNEDSAEKCVACGGANPSKNAEPKSQKDNTFSELVKKQTELWECPTCLTRNNDSVAKCVCCEATRPGSNKHETVKFNFSANPTFKFGIPASVQVEAPKVVEKPKEIESNNNNTPKTVTFTFGVPKPAEEKEAKETPKFSFGKPAETATPAFKFNVPDNPKGEDTQKDKSKTEVDGVKSTDDKDVGFKLPTMNASPGLFTFNAQKPTEPQEKSQTTIEPSTLPVLAMPTAKTAENSSKPPPVLFGVPSTAGKTLAAPLLAMSSPIANTTVSAKSTLFGIPPTTKTEINAASPAFGVTSTPKTESTPTLFSMASAKKSDANTGGMFGIPPAKPADSLAVTKSDVLPTQGFSVAKTDAQNTGQPTLFKFGETTQGNANPPSKGFSFSFVGTPSEAAPQFNSSFGSNSKPPPAYGATNALPSFGATNTQANATPIFGSLPTQAGSMPAFGTAQTSATLPAFGSSTTVAGSTPAFGTAQTSAALPAFGSSTTLAGSTPAFGTAQTSAALPAFGSSTTQAGSTPAFGTAQSSAALPAFGSSTTQAGSTPAFGTAQTSAALPAFGSLSQTTPAFGSSTTQAKTSVPTFGTLTTQTNIPAPTFGSLTTQAPPTFGSTNSAIPSSFSAPSPMFGSQPQSSLFGATGQAENKFAAPGAKPAFSFGASNSPFGNQNQTANVFGSNQTQSMFSPQPANPMGMFGSPAPAFGSPSNMPSLGQQPTQLGQQQTQLGQPQAQLGQTQAFSFGSPNAAPVFAFGQQAAPPQQAPGMFNFAATAAPNVQFNLGSSTGSPQAALPAGRKLRKAVRRTQPR